MRPRVSAFLLVLGLLAGCDNGEDRKPKNLLQEQTDTDKEIAKNGLPAIEGELMRRLNAAIRSADGIVYVTETGFGDLESYVLPTGAPWMLSCGYSGVMVTLGASVTGDGSSVGNDLQLVLFYNPLEKASCADIAHLLGQRLKALFAP